MRLMFKLFFISVSRPLIISVFEQKSKHKQHLIELACSSLIKFEVIFTHGVVSHVERSDSTAKL